MSDIHSALHPVASPAGKKPRGRPRKPNAHIDGHALTRDAIIGKAVELARTESLVDVTTVRLAREFGVVPSLIHYYIGGRDELVSGVVNRYFRERAANMPKPTGKLRQDVRKIARTAMAHMLEYRGIAEYVATHNRFRLFQKVAPGETDYGLEFFNRFAETLKCCGLSPKAAAMGYHLLMQFLVSSAMAEIARLTPAKHKQYILSRLSGLDAVQYGGARYVSAEFARLDAAQIFEAGLEILIDGIARLK